MTVLPESPRVYVVGKNPLVTRAVSKLLELDDQIEVLGESPSIGTAPIAQLRPDLLVLDQEEQAVELGHVESYLGRVAPQTKICLLESLLDLTVGELIEHVKSLGAPAHTGDAHLQAVRTPTGGDSLAYLSERELCVVRLIAEGLSNKEISSRLCLSDKTVKNHISHILAKMHLTARTQVAVHALRAGLV